MFSQHSQCMQIRPLVFIKHCLMEKTSIAEILSFMYQQMYVPIKIETLLVYSFRMQIFHVKAVKPSRIMVKVCFEIIKLPKCKYYLVIVIQYISYSCRYCLSEESQSGFNYYNDQWRGHFTSLDLAVIILFFFAALADLSLAKWSNSRSKLTTLVAVLCWLLVNVIAILFQAVR